MGGVCFTFLGGASMEMGSVSWWEGGGWVRAVGGVKWWKEAIRCGAGEEVQGR